LDFQIEPYSFQDPKKFLENLPSREEKEIIFPFDFHTHESFIFEHKAKTK